MHVNELLRLRYLAPIAALTLGLGVAACNEDGGGDTDQVGAVPTEPAEPAPMDQPAPDPAQ